MWVFEGMDGAGKSTQAARLVDAMTARGRAPLHLREPGSTQWGERIRALLIDADREPVSPRAEALLFFAARVEMLRQEVGPALARGQDVVCERFTPSTLAYQGNDPADAAFILELDSLLVPAELQPHAVFLIDLEPEASFARVEAGGLDGFEKRGVEFQRQVREGYRRYATARPQTSVVLDGSLSAEAIAELVLAEVARRSA